MKAYTMGITKEQFVNETIKHQHADAFLRGKYSKIENGNFKGCAVGCAVKSISDLKGLPTTNYDSHVMYETHLGVPEWLARLEDSLFENVSLEQSKIWPLEFAQAINEGSDLDKIKVPFIVYLMRENIKSIDACVYDAESNPEVKKAIDQTRDALNQMIDAQESGDGQKISAAWSAARSAESAAESAAWSAAWSAAESAAESAAWSAAESAAWSAAESAAESAFGRHADKLLDLMRDCHE